MVGNAFTIYDLAAIELRVLADYVIRANPATQDAIPTALLAGQDPHSLTVTRVFNIPYEEVEAKKDTDPLMASRRASCKTTNFSAVFDIGPATLAMRIHTDTKDSRPLGIAQVAEAKMFLKGMWQANPDAEKVLKGFEKLALHDGYVETIGGRRRYFPTLVPGTAEYHALRGGVCRAARNIPIQGSAADILKLAQVLIQRRLWRSGLPAFLANAVHDEIIVEEPIEAADQVNAIVAGALEEAFAHYIKHVPFKAAGGTRMSWTH
jgi:DNA polymerase-1